MNKTYRQGQILRLIRAQRIVTQEQLAQELASVGVSTTQVTLSRDIRELGLVKTSEGYRQVSAGSVGPSIETVASEFLLDVRAAQNLVVLKTSPGHANTLAIALDQEEWSEIVGTIAGDDTVLVIAPDNGTATLLRDRFLGFLVA
jgi:transcriptional regulator of arginine metabolism